VREAHFISGKCVPICFANEGEGFTHTHTHTRDFMYIYTHVLEVLGNNGGELKENNNLRFPRRFISRPRVVAVRLIQNVSEKAPNGVSLYILLMRV